MPDHVHILLTPARDDEGSTYGFAEIMSAIKGASSHRINQVLGRRGRVWQPESFDRAVRTAESLRQKAEYICENSVRAGLVDSVDEYRWIWREWVEGNEAERRPDE
jgi:REP element-mobilizing transposase RayT